MPLSVPPGLDTCAFHLCNGSHIVDPALGLIGYLLRKDQTVSLGRPATHPFCPMRNGQESEGSDL